MIIFDGFEKWIKESGLKRAEIAEKLGINLTTLNLSLRTRTGFKTEVLDRICSLTGLSIEQLMTWYPDTTIDLAREYKENDVNYEKLFILMKEKDLSDYALSKAVGKSISYINSVRRKGRKISTDTLKQIADFLQVKPTDLFDIIKNPETSKS